ncbi:tetratricopeptide repeat protein [Fulvivirga lutea]|uniref:Tetratricopeptide repeat protein n=1 Tax=Fulvivirga lutea TaxID=2810512 RepID=A0A975A2Q3_9BACT|nr:hypothetical protein [Fulvivirga lutea]QSE98787.1 hypothetical protein JR347_06835 [Fulvivirga lutea]
MKKLTLILTLLVGALFTNAKDKSAYINAMQDQIETFKGSKSQEELQASANAFERIAQKENEEWLPLYYAAHAYIKIGFNNTLSLDERDSYFDKAIALIEKAGEISPNNSELTALKGFALMGKLSADPANRGQTMSPLVMQTFGQAMQQNPENPRALVLMAQMEFGMAQFFGNGTEKACGMANGSLALFEAEASEGINPTWGAGQAQALLSKCK